MYEMGTAVECKNHIQTAVLPYPHFLLHTVYVLGVIFTFHICVKIPPTVKGDFT